MNSKDFGGEGEPMVEPKPDDVVASDLRFVGIAASAGGLEAISLLVNNLPRKANAVYVIAQHMSPTYKSVLSSLIARETELDVVELVDDAIPVAERVYVTPPNKDVVFADGRLRLRTPAGHSASPKPSADRLFKSLAEAVGERCLGIVLSGTGSDGSYGIQAIREAGGVTIAQDPASAKYDGMPTSACETGCVDLTLSPAQIGVHLEKILARSRSFEITGESDENANPMSELFSILQARTQVNFSEYKHNTLNRRIARRMDALGVETYEQYLDICRTEVDEVDALHRDLLISVTRFFRDPDQFEKLRNELDRMIEGRRPGPIRIWVVGCATGEEAYSIAVTVVDILGGIKALEYSSVQIFATDIDKRAIEVARKGVYPITAAQDIPAEYLESYFITKDDVLTVRPEIRALTMFSHHNVFQDPPFVNLDLVSMRNILIYFNIALQERVLSRVHYALASEGLLFLGTSESVGEMNLFFDARNGMDRIFCKRRGVSGDPSAQPGLRVFNAARPSHAHQKSMQDANKTFADMDMALARVVAPNGFICTNTGNIIEVLGDINAHIEIRPGAATSLNVRMLREPLKSEVLSMVSIAIRNKKRRDGRWHTVSLPMGNRLQMQVFPFESRDGGEVHCVVAINTKFEEELDVQSSDISNAKQRAYVERMEQEIRSTQDALQQTIEELQTTNEVLQLSNEELQSTNEEFQATNEELETSNEELQSTNEELLTVNEELQVSSAERLALSSELEATLETAPYVLMLADQALVLRRLSKMGLKFFDLPKIGPAGIHLSQCTLPQGFPSLLPMANAVIKSQEATRLTIEARAQTYVVNMAPAFDKHGKLLGLTITITRSAAGQVNRVLDMVQETSRFGHWSFDMHREDLNWSSQMNRILERDSEGEPTWADVREVLYPEEAMPKPSDIDEWDTGGIYTYEHDVPTDDGRTKTILGKTMVMRDMLGQPYRLIGVIWDAQHVDRGNET